MQITQNQSKSHKHIVHLQQVLLVEENSKSLREVLKVSTVQGGYH